MVLAMRVITGPGTSTFRNAKSGGAIANDQYFTMRKRPVIVICSFTLTRVGDQCVSYHCTVAILRNGGSARSPCAAAAPGTSAAAMLSTKMNESAEALTAEAFR